MKCLRKSFLGKFMIILGMFSMFSCGCMAAKKPERKITAIYVKQTDALKRTMGVAAFYEDGRGTEILYNIIGRYDILYDLYPNYERIDEGDAEFEEVCSLAEKIIKVNKELDKCDFTIEDYFCSAYQVKKLLREKSELVEKMDGYLNIKI